MWRKRKRVRKEEEESMLLTYATLGRKQFKSFLVQQELDSNLVSNLLSSLLGKKKETERG